LEIAQAKSGEFLGWAAWSGAAVASVDVPILTYYWRYGYYLGILLQLADDFNGIWNPEEVSDLIRGSLSLPICYALSVISPKEQTDLTQLLERARHGDTHSEALIRQRLIDLGAQAYLLVVAQIQYQQAVTALQQANYPTSDDFGLVKLLMKVMPGLRYAALSFDKASS
jgi:geranylgeranyl pyrophosphate synthase